MTVCLAALCVAPPADGVGPGLPAAVVAADRMVTLGGIIEFEHANKKMAHPSTHAVTMIAGDTLAGTTLAQDVADSFNGTSPRSAEIADKLATQYGAMRLQRMANDVLLPRGLDLAEFYNRHASLNANVTMMIDNFMAQYNLGVELLLAGVDADGAHIFSIGNPGGTAQRHDVIGYTATGSGALHALQAMIGFGHHAAVPLRETVFRAYAAKRRAEVAPGVGHDTDIGIITGETSVTFLTEEQLKTLESAYETHESVTKDALNHQLEELALTFGEGKGHGTND